MNRAQHFTNSVTRHLPHTGRTIENERREDGAAVSPAMVMDFSGCKYFIKCSLVANLGEEDKGDKLNRFVIQLSALADVYVNDAFGSWQPHGSTYHIAKYLPSYAGLCMQGELYHVQSVLNPSKPFVAIVAGAKYDTKIGPLKEIYKKVDKLVLGGLIYNTYLCAKYGVKISGVEESDIELAKELVVQDKVHKKILELQVLVETDTLEGRFEGKFRTIDVKDFAPGQTYKYVVDVDPVSFKRDEVEQEMNSAKTIFVNAVMGLMPHFWHGTIKMDEVIDKNRSAQKFFGGGDTLQTFKRQIIRAYHFGRQESLEHHTQQENITSPLSCGQTSLYSPSQIFRFPSQ